MSAFLGAFFGVLLGLGGLLYLPHAARAWRRLRPRLVHFLSTRGDRTWTSRRVGFWP